MIAADPSAVAPATTNRRLILLVIALSPSALFFKNLVDGHDREGARAACVIDARYRIDGFADLRGCKSVPRRDHARGARPRVGLGIIDLVGAKNAAEVVDPTFTAEHVNFAVGGRNSGARARRWHRRARCPGVGGDVVSLVHPYVRGPSAGIARADAAADRVDLAVGESNAVMV